MLTSYMQSFEMSQSRCPLLELVRTVYSPEAIADVCKSAGEHPRLLPQVLTVRQAAERIYTAINVAIQDTTLKFDVGVNVREQLIDLRDRRRQKREQQRQAERSGNAEIAISSGECNSKAITRLALALLSKAMAR
ncbi:unnamed protein product [Phytophthora lilii]|uniref:Unnamed protein product n=1 Tax=Phytophthora lilii TaxID=2077276 RepID=A0A9W6WTB6_9STRA|nr:unnamed protein product [Phytophthora lilii]